MPQAHALSSILATFQQDPHRYTYLSIHYVYHSVVKYVGSLLTQVLLKIISLNKLTGRLLKTIIIFFTKSVARCYTYSKTTTNKLSFHNTDQLLPRILSYCFTIYKVHGMPFIQYHYFSADYEINLCK